jgi:hypothetical protein
VQKRRPIGGSSFSPESLRLSGGPAKRDELRFAGFADRVGKPLPAPLLLLIDEKSAIFHRVGNEFYVSHIKIA